MIQTEVPENTMAYVRRQSRWVRSLLQFALHFRRWNVAGSLLLAGAIGATMLLTPLLAVMLGPIALAAGLLGWLWAASSRQRYFRLINAFEGEAADLHRAILLQLMIADFGVWATAPLALLVPRLRNAW